LIFVGLAAGDHWIVLTTKYQGVCAAFAFHEPRVIAAGGSRTGRHTVLVVDGAGLIVTGVHTGPLLLDTEISR
jgi:hypothetical protein